MPDNLDPALQDLLNRASGQPPVPGANMSVESQGGQAIAVTGNAKTPKPAAPDAPRGFMQDMPNEPIVYGLRHGVATLGMGAHRVADGLHDLVMGKSYDEKVLGAAAVVNGLFQMGISPFTVPAASIGKALSQSYPDLSKTEILDPKFAGFLRTMMGQIPHKPTEAEYASMSAADQAKYRAELDAVSAPFTFREGVETAITMAGPILLTEAMRKPKTESSSAKPATGDEPTPVAEQVDLYRGGASGTTGEFWSPKEEVAKTYAGDAGTVTKQTHDFKNLLVADNWMDAKEKLGLPRSASMPDLVEASKHAGYDGMRFQGAHGVEYVAPSKVAAGPLNLTAISDVEAQAFVDRVQTGETPTVPPAEAQGPRMFGVNWQRLGQEESVNRVIMDLNRTLTDTGASEVAARGIRTHDLTTQAARDLGTTVQDVLKIQPGTAVNAEQMQGIRGVRDAVARSLTKQAEMAVGGDPSARADLPTLIALNYEVNLRVRGVTAEAGRALESMKMPSDATLSATSMRDLNAMVERINGMTDIDKAAEMVVNLKGRPDSATRNFIENLGEAAKTGKDIVWEVYVNSLLSGPATLTKKVISDGLRAMWEIPQRAVARLNHQLFFPDDPLGVAPGEAKAMARGMGRGFANAIRSVGMEETDLSTGLGEKAGFYKSALTAERLGVAPDNPVGRAVDLMGSIVRTPGEAIGIATNVAKATNYQMELSAQAVRDAHLKGFTGEQFANHVAYVEAHPADFPYIADAAQQAALVNTFTNDLGAFGSGLTKALNAAHLRAQVPFLRIPLNITKFGVQTTPGFNIPSLLWGELNQQIKLGGAARELALAKVEMGALAASAVAYYVANGQITGSGPKDAGLREERRALGIPDNSIRIGGTWYRYNLLEPGGTLIGLIADTAETWAQVPAEGEYLDRAMQAGATAAIALGHEMANKPFFTGIKNVLDAIEQPTQSANIIAKGWARSLVPALIRRGNQAYWDTTMREARTPLQALQAVTPGYSEDLPPHRNPITGKAIQFPAALGPDIASPLSYMEEKPDPVMLALVSNNISVKPLPWAIAGTAPPMMEMKEPAATEGIPLTPQQRDRWITLMTQDVTVRGMNLYDQLLRLIQTPQWATASSGAGEGRDALVQDWTRAYREAARMRLLKEDQDLLATVQERERSKIQGKWLPTTDPRSPQFRKPGATPPELGKLLESIGR